MRVEAVHSVHITVNGVPLAQVGRIEHGVALAPVGPLVRAMGGTVIEGARSPAAHISLGGHRVGAVAREPLLKVDGRLQPAPLAPRLIGGRLFVPARALLADTGYALHWVARTSTLAVVTERPLLPRLRPPTPTPDLRTAPVRPAPAARTPPPPASVIPYTAADLNLIARVVHGEADGQPLEARIGVAAVIVNRVRDPGWPKTIPGVIYDPNQFQAVGAPLFNAGPAAADVTAALAALRGQDPTHGAQYFYNPQDTWGGSWIFTRPTLVSIGSFRFAS